MPGRVQDLLLPALAAAVVLQAIKDYKLIIRGGYVPKESRESLERFLTSEYCHDLMTVAGLEVDPEKMISEIKKHIFQTDKHFQF